MIWLVGNKGMLGAQVETLLLENGVPHVSTDREVDITRADSIAGYLDTLKPAHPEWIINCAAYTAVDLAEDEVQSAYALNAEGPRNLALSAQKADAALVHISTDYIFSGEKVEDYEEDDPPEPINVYGKSKLKGESAVRQVLEQHYIIRTAWLYGRGGRNFVDTMLKLFQEPRTVRVVRDQIGNPTYAVDLARAIMRIVLWRERRYGTYNFTNEGRTSWYAFAHAIHEDAVSLGLANPRVEILPITTEEFPTKTRRPRSSCLSKEKIKREIGLSIRNWREALRSYMETRAGGSS